MPLHDAVSTDPLSSMMSLHSSPVFELLSSTQGIYTELRLEGLVEDVRAALGQVFIDEIKQAYAGFSGCCSYAELAVDFSKHDDVPAFFEYIDGMPERTFAFYLLGRWFPPESVPETVSQKSINRLFESNAHEEELRQIYPDLSYFDDLAAYKHTLVTLWKRYWNSFLSKKIPEIKIEWQNSIREKQQILEREGGTVLLKRLSSYEKLPKPVPPDQPFQSIEVIPIYYAPRCMLMYYGYGKVHLLYDCRQTEESRQKIEALKSDLLAVFKALSDEKRLKILKFIAFNEQIANGKTIAERLELSSSVVSRHLAQLRTCGIINEHSPDNRNITYSLDMEKISAISTDLQSFIKS